MTKQLTGRHVLMIFCGAFGIIIGVNLLLAWSAVSTFPGLEVKNSYVASQQFDERKAAQEALGWTVRADAAEGEVILRFTDAQGLPVRVGALDAVVGRATHVADDIRPEFIFDGVAYVAPVHLADGNWNIRLTALAENGTQFSQRVILHVKR
ncbi:MAG: FixH family protein [Paracoccaceae bacterium]|jgi:nitrogen fixation protein FixH|uniref:FixH family protein n=1 Tax=unclassified Seohaeicola TaxID=2641111 RepID=UPI00237AE0B3|nr:MULTISPECIES: FixH family protein [unclassified Seohaeicola]MDD9705828.1 FixH family protein [Seohaeicola sp. 4SK31]MDD9735339.1 FixH family protein [Seohaeicola sp. SP36]MDF1708586.1 FixH family protein [Paracoccaceae bacterium]MDM7969813.1 FixH family protein [Paracoccaceae bacterium]